MTEITRKLERLTTAERPVSSAADDFDLESAKALAFVEAPDSPTEKETLRLAGTLLDACDTIGWLRATNDAWHEPGYYTWHQEQITSRDREIEKLRAEVKCLEQLVHDAASDGACVEALKDHLATKQNAERLAQMLASAGKQIERLEGGLVRGIDRAEEAEREREDAVLSRRQISDARDQLVKERDDLQRQLGRAITIREEARDLQVQAEDELDAANEKIIVLRNENPSTAGLVDEIEGWRKKCDAANAKAEQLAALADAPEGKDDG